MSIETMERSIEDEHGKNELQWDKKYNYLTFEEIPKIQKDLSKLQDTLKKDSKESIHEAVDVEKDIAKKLIDIMSKDSQQLHLLLPKKHYATGIIHRINEIIFRDSKEKLININLAIDEAIGNMKRYDTGHDNIKLSVFYTPSSKVQYLIGEKENTTENINDKEIEKRSELPVDLMEEHGRGFFFMKNVTRFEARRDPHRVEIEYDINGKKEKKPVSIHAYLIEQNIEN